MKSFISLVIIGLSLSISTMMVAVMPQPEFEKVVAALERSDAEEVEKLLGADTLNEEQRKELLEKATTIFAERGQSVKLLEKSYSGLAKITPGAVLTLIGSFTGGMLTVKAIVKGLEVHVSDCLMGLLTLPSLGVGIYLMKKGWAPRVTALELYENAEKIKGLLEAAPVG